jgi:TPR repeat protein
MNEAVRWFIRAARQGDKTAQHNLGVYYATQEAKQEAAAAAEAARAAENAEGGTA